MKWAKQLVRLELILELFLTCNFSARISLKKGCSLIAQKPKKLIDSGRFQWLTTVNSLGAKQPRPQKIKGAYEVRENFRSNQTRTK